MKKYDEVIKKGLPILGLFLVSMIALPYFLLGEGSYVQMHDQMDSEILNYIYQAKYFLRGDVVAEFMNGMPKASMLPPAPLGVLAYLILPPFYAYACMHWLVLAVGFCGMYFLADKCGARREISFFAALLFCYMPFYPAYGLASLGQPLLILCAWKLFENRKAILPWLGIILYGALSSLTLIGFVWLIAGVLLTIGLALWRKKSQALTMCGATAALLATYLITNLNLIKELLGGGFVTHREEMQVWANPDFWGEVKNLLFVGGSYSNVYSSAVLIFALLILFIALVVKRIEGWQPNIQKNFRMLFGLLIAVIILTIFSASWSSVPVCTLREWLGGPFRYFNAGRINWTFPFLWMLVFVYAMQLTCDIWLEQKKNWFRTALGILAAGLLLAQGIQIFRDSTLNKNMRLVLFPDYKQITWESVYMEEVFREIDSVIGDEKQSCSVVSLGMYPAVALYNGYTCADGYSNNYNLDYKHQFRNVIEEELDKDPEVKRYFDEWGNRCYLVSAQYGFNAVMAKGQDLAFEEVSFDIEAMKALNIRYIFAAAPIANADEMSMSLIEGSPFSDDTSFYEVWLYRIME